MQQNRAELTLNWGRTSEGRDTSSEHGVPLIQSGHTFLQIILLIIPERSIAALNQAELWARSLCL